MITYFLSKLEHKYKWKGNVSQSGDFISYNSNDIAELFDVRRRTMSHHFERTFNNVKHLVAFTESLCECVYFNETPELLNLFPHLHNTTSMELFLTWDTSSRLQRNGALASYKHYLWMTIRIMCSIYIHSIEYFIFYSLSIFMKMRNIKIVFMNGGCYITSFFNL